ERIAAARRVARRLPPAADHRAVLCRRPQEAHGRQRVEPRLPLLAELRLAAMQPFLDPRVEDPELRQRRVPAHEVAGDRQLAEAADAMVNAWAQRTPRG